MCAYVPLPNASKKLGKKIPPPPPLSCYFYYLYNNYSSYGLHSKQYNIAPIQLGTYTHNNCPKTDRQTDRQTGAFSFSPPDVKQPSKLMCVVWFDDLARTSSTYGICVIPSCVCSVKLGYMLAERKT